MGSLVSTFHNGWLPPTHLRFLDRYKSPATAIIKTHKPMTAAPRIPGRFPATEYERLKIVNPMFSVAVRHNRCQFLQQQK